MKKFSPWAYEGFMTLIDLDNKSGGTIPLDPNAPKTATRDRCLGEGSFPPEGRLTDVEFWNRRQIAFASGGDDVHVPKWYPKISRFLPKSPDTTFLEVGVVPGHVMLFFAQRLHYQCTGVDFSPRIRHLPSLFASRGLKANFVETDFLEWSGSGRFDIVFSSGFIEHFTDYEMVILKHWDKVAPGGLMILAVPTFKTPLQWWMRRLFYEPWFLREVLASHNLAIMSLEALRECVKKVCPEARVLLAVREPGVPLWIHPNMKGIRKGPGLKSLWLLVRVFDRILCVFGVSSKWCAGVALVMASKEGE